MKQTPAHTQVAGIDHDDNFTHVDGLGGQVAWLAPAGAPASTFGTPAPAQG
jgi:hypothetical protein